MFVLLLDRISSDNLNLSKQNINFSEDKHLLLLNDDTFIRIIHYFRIFHHTYIIKKNKYYHTLREDVKQTCEYLQNYEIEVGMNIKSY